MADLKSSQLLKVLLFLFVMLFVVFMYTFLHEGGHALLGLLSGGSITAFNLNFLDISAHVGLSGSFTPAQLIANNLAGVALPLLAWLVFFLVVPRRSNLVLESIKVGSSMVVLNTLLVWIVFPLLFMVGIAPSDDSTNFLNNSGVYPPLVSLAALLMYIGGWALFRSRITDLSGELGFFRQTDRVLITPGVRKTVLFLVVIFAVCGLLAFTANGFKFGAAAPDPYQPPPGYAPQATINLSDEDFSDRPVYIFNVEKTSRVGIFVLVSQVESDYFEVKLTGPDNFSRVIVHAEGYTARRDNPRLEETLQPGQYRLVMTSRQSVGQVSIYTYGLD